MPLREHIWRKLHSGNIPYFPIFILFLCVAYKGKGKRNTLRNENYRELLCVRLFSISIHLTKGKNPHLLFCINIFIFYKDGNTVHETIIPQRTIRSNFFFFYFIDLATWIFLAKKCPLDFSVQHSKSIAVSDISAYLDFIYAECYTNTKFWKKKMVWHNIMEEDSFYSIWNH